MKSIPISSIVSINPGVLSAGGNSIVLNGLILTQSTAVPVGQVMPFASKDDVANFFGATSTEATLAAEYFLGYDNKTQTPKQLYFMQYNLAAVAAYTRGASLGSMTLTQLQALSGTLTVTVDGAAAETSANINLSSATSFSNAATLIQAAFTSPNFTVSYDGQRKAFEFTSNTTGTNSAVSFLSGTLAAPLYLTQATGAVQSLGAAAATPAGAMNNAISITRNWAGFMTAFEPVTADKMSFAQWTNQQNKRFVYAAWDTDATATQANNTTSFGPQVIAAAYDGTVPIYNTADVAAFVLGTMASIDFTRNNGRITFAFKSQSGLGVTVADATSAANLIANGYNYYGAYANATNNWNFYYPGSVSGKYDYLDELVNEIWLNAQLETAFATLLTSVNNIPYNPMGYGLMEAAALDPIKAAVTFGAIRPNVTLSSAQAAEVNAAAGVAIDKVLSSRGWYLQILDASAQTRGQRQSPPCTLWYMDGGAVQSISLASIVVQ